MANYNAAVLGNHVRGTANSSVSTGVMGFPRGLRSVDSTRPIKGALTRWLRSGFDNTTSCSGFHPTDPQAQRYGRYS